MAPNENSFCLKELSHVSKTHGTTEHTNNRRQKEGPSIPSNPYWQRLRGDGLDSGQVKNTRDRIQVPSHMTTLLLAQGLFIEFESFNFIALREST